MDNQDQFLDKIRDRIFSLLLSEKLPQKDFAKAIGTSAQTVTDWKKGKSRSYMQKLPLIASTLHSNLDWIYDGVSDKSVTDGCEQQAFDHLLEMAYQSRFVGFDGEHIGPAGEDSDLLGEKKQPTVQDDGLSEAEQALMDLFRKLSPDQQEMVIRMVKAAADKL